MTNTENTIKELTPQRLTMSVKEAAILIGISYNAAYESAKKGELPTVKFGRRILVPIAALEKMLAGATA